jgi:DNA-binding beta-propeller fold protein YncE
MKKIGLLVGADRPDRAPRRSALGRLARSVATFALLASLVVSPDAEPMVLGGGAGAAVPAAFSSESTDQFGGVQRPTRIALSDSGEIYVSDTLRGVVAIFDGQGRRVGTLSGLQEPLGLAVSVRNRCTGCGGSCQQTQMAYVGDQSDGSVAVFEDGQRVRVLGAGAGEFLKPNGIASTRAQVVYVADSEARTIKIFAPDGTLDKTVGSTAWEWYPIDIALNEVTRELYVADHVNRSISVFDFDGVWLRNLSAPNNDQGDPAFYRIAGLGIDPSGNLYVVDSALSSVSILTPDGALVDIIGYQLGTYWTGELNVPIDAAADRGRVYVTSSNDHMVKIFGLAP